MPSNTRKLKSKEYIVFMFCMNGANRVATEIVTDYGKCKFAAVYININVGTYIL